MMTCIDTTVLLLLTSCIHQILEAGRNAAKHGKQVRRHHTCVQEIFDLAPWHRPRLVTKL